MHVENKMVQADLPVLPCALVSQPQVVLDIKMVKIKNQVATQILVLWKGLLSSHATREFIDDLYLRFSKISLKDKGTLKEDKLS